MTVIPFRARYGLTSTEMAALVVFANETDICIETGTTEEGWLYATLDLGRCYGLAAGEAVWVVSREQSQIFAYDEEDGLLLSFKTVADALMAFRRLLPPRHAEIG